MADLRYSSNGLMVHVSRQRWGCVWFSKDSTTSHLSWHDTREEADAAIKARADAGHVTVGPVDLWKTATRGTNHE
jgi:hypothetical protein